ncbi:MAG: nucleotidyl transferase AbiEii/AbiGii toxin family protein [Solirubrobacterales bacterium]
MHEFGLPQDEVLKIVARSVVVRRLAQDYEDQYVLKGGALLFHVYNGPRASFMDTDFASTGLADQNGVLDEIISDFSIDEDGFILDAADGIWKPVDEVIKGNRVPFTVKLDDATLDRERLNISISIRTAEVLDDTGPHWYDASKFLTTQGFMVHGLSLNELAAEKIIGAALKGLPKHVVDLALIARDKATQIDTSRVTELVRDKVRIESKQPETASLFKAKGVSRASDLAKVFLSSSDRSTMQRTWDEVIVNQVWLNDDELQRTDSLERLDTVMEHVDEFWLPVVQSF